MNVFIFTIWLLLPNGDMKLSSTLVTECPSQQAVSETFQNMFDKGEIKDARAACQSVDAKKV